jgi:hypothetical protein
MSKFKPFTKVKIVSLPKDWRGDNKLEDLLGKVATVVDVVEDYCLVNSPANFVGLFWIKEDHLQEVIEDGKVEDKPYNPLVAQEGGGHYKNRGIQPIEYSEANNLGACQHSVVKYITRHQDKNGIEDLSKIIHFTFLEAFFKYGEQGSTELKEKVLKLLGVTE